MLLYMKIQRSILILTFLFVSLTGVELVLSFEQSNQTVPLVINELMASNSDFEPDPQGEYDDWIELYNYSDYAVDIGGMYLTDNFSEPAGWQIPAGTSIGAGGYLLIWADDDTGDAGLHANFKLDADGEEIGLFDSDGFTLIDSVVFFEQTTDISYGRYPDAADDWSFFGDPSPAAQNEGGFSGEVEAPVISHDTGLYDEPFLVTITTETEDAVIYYTLNGYDPLEPSLRGTPIGTVYTGPILIGGTARLRAQAIKTGWKPSAIETQAYTFLEPDVRDFSSNLPLFIVETYGQSIVYTGRNVYKEALLVTVAPDETTGRAVIDGTCDFSGHCGFRVRGRSSSFLWPKMQYALETRDRFDSDKSVSILGLPEESDWILVGPYSDKTLMRTVLPFQWSNEIGRYAARTRFVEMFLNTDGGNLSYDDYLGVYVFMEKIKGDENRVDIEKLTSADNQEPEITGGYILRKDWAESPHFDTVTGMELEYREPKAEEITQTQIDYIKGYIDEFETVLYGGNFKDPVNGYARYIDVDSFIDYHLMTEMPKNGDGYYHSTFMFKDRGGKLQLGPIWDYNLSMGNFGSGILSSTQNWYYPVRSENGTHKWYIRLFEDLEFRLKTADRWFELREDVFGNSKLLADIDGYALLLDEAQVRNFERWDILGREINYNPSGWRDRDTFRKEVDWLKTWLEDRLAWMDQAIANERAAVPPIFYIDGVPDNDGGYIGSGSSLSISSGENNIYYTLDGSDPRIPGRTQPAEPTGRIFVPEEVEKRILVPSEPVSEAWRGSEFFYDRSWMRGAGGVGYDTGTDYLHLIDTDLHDQMYQGQTGCYIRIRFNLTMDLNQLNILILKMHYDDGFIAYLNGTEVARDNFAGTPAWNSFAGGNHEAGANPESFNITDHIGELKTGENILAIHGLNRSADSSDFLIRPELVAENNNVTGDDISPGAVLYDRPITFNGTTHVMARARSGSNWSALNEAIYAAGTVTENLRITEIMYHPVNPAGPDDPNEEFIELTNIGAETIDLNLVKFTDGINFTFPGLELAPGEFVVVVQDRDTFEARYGTQVNIAGQYTDRLNNAGELIRLEDALGRTILEFSYKDGWQPLTDGDGFSLTIIEPANPDPNSWGEKESWRASTYNGGSPGWDDSGQ